MYPWTKFCLGSLAVLVLGYAVKAQEIPGAPPGAAAAGPNLFSMLLPPADMKERCRQKLCKCEIVKMLRGAMAPMAMATGGLIGPGNCCPLVTKEDLAKAKSDPGSSEGAAALIKKDLEEAAARRAAVRFLGTVDCRYWPEAEEALIVALRADKIECVRWEAALALQRGCCCTKKVAKALTICIEGTDKDKNPAERSQRVQDAAAAALAMCAFEEKVEPKEKEKEKEKGKVTAKITPQEFYREVDNASRESIMQDARKVLQQRGAPTSNQVLRSTQRASSQGIFGIVGHAFEATPETPAAATREPQQGTLVSTQPLRRGLLYKLLPGLSFDDNQVAATEPRMAPVTSPEIQQAGWVAGTNNNQGAVKTGGYGGFNTALPQAPVATPTNADQGVLGFVIMEDNPVRR